jgi:hypothetical protein
MTLQNRHGCEARRAGRQNVSPAREGGGSIPKRSERRRRGTKSGLAPAFVIRSELRISCYAAPNNGHVCGFLYYASRHGLGLENWALFEFKAVINPLIPVHRVSKNEPSLQQALEILHLAVAE